MEYGNGMTPADIAAINRGGYGDGFGAQGFWWIIILLLFGWGNNGWGNGNGNTQAEIQRGFDQQATQGAIAGLQAQISNGFSDAAVARCNAQMNLMQTLNQNQLGLYQGLNQLALGQQAANAANQAGLADLKYTVATENCSDRQVVNNGVRDIIANQTANTQALINNQTAGFQALQDKLCQLELDSYKQKNAEQAAEIVSLRGVISQSEQTAKLIQDNNQQTATLIQRIAPAAVPAYPAQGYGQLFGGCCGRAV